MGQRRVTDYFEVIYPPGQQPPASRRCYLLELSVKLRHRIYSFLDIDRPYPIDLNYWHPLTRRRAAHECGLVDEEDEIDNEARCIKQARDDSRIEAGTPPMPFGLLLACRTIHGEIEKLIYRNNHFLISRRDLYGLKALERLSVAALQELRRLTIYLNYESCIGSCCGDKPDYSFGKTCLGYNYCKADGTHDEPLRITLDLAYRLLIKQWEGICQRLSRHITPGRLKLFLACDCDDKSTAEQIVQPLKTLPRLEHLVIRLSRKSQGELQTLARTTALDITRQSHLLPKRPFRFFDLPDEIQCRILKHTPLVLERPRYWTPHFRLHTEYCASSGYAPAKHVARFWNYAWHESAARLCFCMRTHSAYNPDCECEPSHLQLFLVSRRFSQIAKQVFFSVNAFAAKDDYYSGYSEEPRPPFALGIELFMGKLPFPALSMLTSLKFGISNQAFNTNIALHLSRQIHDRWEPIVDLLACFADLRNLSLEIYFDEDDYYSEDYWAEYRTFEAFGDEYFQSRCMWLRYVQFVRPVRKLRDLRRFAIYLTTPASPLERAQCRLMERHLEKIAMGLDHDNKAEGKGAGLVFFDVGNQFNMTPWDEL